MLLCIKCEQLLPAQRQTQANCMLPVQQKMRSLLNAQVTSVCEHDLTSLFL